MPARSEDTYLFIDGEYLRRIFQAAMENMFKCEVRDEDINYIEIMEQARAKRAFFYDCIDDERQSGETETDFQKRVASQGAFFTNLGKLRGFHVRQGSLKGTGKKRRQKEVDVLLATDMLTHGYDGNMETAVLIAGDLDFRPVVESLVRRGVFVEVWYEPRSASAELPGAADYGRRLDFHTLYQWSTTYFQVNHPRPKFLTGHAPVEGNLIKRGKFNGKPVLLIKPDTPDFVLKIETADGVRWHEHKDPGVIERYAELIHGRIEWE